MLSVQFRGFKYTNTVVSLVHLQNFFIIPNWNSEPNKQ